MTTERDEPLQTEVTPPETLGSPGGMIRRARTQAGFGTEEFAAQIRLSRVTLEALENDDFATLREPVYVRGYYRKCARLLGLPEDELIAAYEKHARPPAPAMPSKIPVVDGGIEVRSGGVLRWLLGVLVVVAVLAAVAWFLQEEPGVYEDLSGSPQAVETLPGTVQPPVQPPVQAPAAAEPPAPSPTGGDRPATAEGPEPAASAEPSAGSPAGAQDVLVLRFTENSWVRVQGGDGQTLVSGLIREGTVHSFEDSAPYTVFLGYAPGVQLEFRGRPVDLSGMTRENNTANLRLPSEG